MKLYIVAGSYAKFIRFCNTAGLITAHSEMQNQDINQSALVGEAHYIATYQQAIELVAPRVIILESANQHKDYDKIKQALVMHNAVMTHAAL